MFQGTPQQGEHFIDFEGLDDIIVRAKFDRLDSHTHVFYGGNHDDVNVLIHGLNTA